MSIPDALYFADQLDTWGRGQWPYEDASSLIQRGTDIADQLAKLIGDSKTVDQARIMDFAEQCRGMLQTVREFNDSYPITWRDLSDNRRETDSRGVRCWQDRAGNGDGGSLICFCDFDLSPMRKSEPVPGLVEQKTGIVDEVSEYPHGFDTNLYFPSPILKAAEGAAIAACGLARLMWDWADALATQQDRDDAFELSLSGLAPNYAEMRRQKYYAKRDMVSENRALPRTPPGVSTEERCILKVMSIDPRKAWRITGKDGICSVMQTKSEFRVGIKTVGKLLPFLAEKGYVVSKEKRYTITKHGLTAAKNPPGGSCRKARPLSDR